MRKLFKYGLAVVRAKKLLVVRKSNTTKYIMPGGQPKKGERVEETLMREIKEELGVRIKLDSIKFYGTFKDIAANELDTTIEISVYIGEVEGNLVPSSEIEEIAWIESQYEIPLAPSIENKILPSLVNDRIIL